MERVSNRKIALSSLLCLLPVAAGSVLWGILPEKLVQNIGLFGRFGFLPKAVIVFVFPALFLVVHLIFYFKPGWLNTRRIAKRLWLMPLLSNLFFIFSCALGFAASLNG